MKRAVRMITETFLEISNFDKRYLGPPNRYRPDFIAMYRPNSIKNTKKAKKKFFEISTQILGIIF